MESTLPKRMTKRRCPTWSALRGARRSTAAPRLSTRPGIAHLVDLAHRPAGDRERAAPLGGHRLRHEAHHVARLVDPVPSGALVNVGPVFGLHRVQQRSGKVVYFVVMGNIFPIDRPVHERFDLKARDLAEIQPRYRRDTDEILQGRYRPRAAARRAPS